MKLSKRSIKIIPINSTSAGVFDLSDADEDDFGPEIEQLEAAAIAKFGPYSKRWPSLLWDIVVKHIDDDLLSQMSAVPAPNVPRLLTELLHALSMAIIKVPGYYRQIFYTIAMEPHGDAATLQLFIVKFTKLLADLKQEGQAPSDLERNQAFLRGLAQPFHLLVQSASTPSSAGYTWTWEELLQATRHTAALPFVAQQLLAFDKRTASTTNPTSIFYSGSAASPADEKAVVIKVNELCRAHALGKCKWGKRCKFIHAGETHDQQLPSAPGGPITPKPFCTHCRRPGHLKDACNNLKKGHPPNTTRLLPQNLHPRQPRAPVQMHAVVAAPIIDENEYYFELLMLDNEIEESDDEPPMLIDSSESDNSDEDGIAQDRTPFDVSFSSSSEATTAENDGVVDESEHYFGLSMVDDEIMVGDDEPPMLLDSSESDDSDEDDVAQDKTLPAAPAISFTSKSDATTAKNDDSPPIVNNRPTGTSRSTFQLLQMLGERAMAHKATQTEFNYRFLCSCSDLAPVVPIASPYLEEKDDPLPHKRAKQQPQPAAPFPVLADPFPAYGDAHAILAVEQDDPQAMLGYVPKSEAIRYPTYSSHLGCRGWPRPPKTPRVKANMQRMDSACAMCHVEFKYREHHEDHDDSDRHYNVWSHLYAVPDDDYCEECHIVPECPVEHFQKKNGRHSRSVRKAFANVGENANDVKADAIQNVFANFSETQPLQSTSSSSSAPTDSARVFAPDDAAAAFALETFAFPAVQAVGGRSREWIADTGATRSATHSAVGLYNERQCRIHITGVGGGFVVTRAGLLDLPVQLDNGVVDSITISVLVHEDFPLNLLSLQDLIAARGGFVFGANTFTQVNSLREGEQGKINGHRSPTSRLYTLSQPIFPLDTSPVRTVSKRSGGGDEGDGDGAPSTKRQTTMAAFAKTMDSPSASVSSVSGAAPGSSENCLVCGVEAMLVAKTYSSAAPNSAHQNITLLHNKHGHIDFKKICEYYGIPVPKTMPPCFPCIRGKLHRATPTTAGEAKATRRAEIFHADIRGPMPVMSKEGYWYIAIIVDDYTSRVHGFGLKTTEQWFELWSYFVRKVEAALGYKGCIKALRTDGASYFMSKAMADHALQSGYVQHSSSRYAQWGNYCAERHTGTIGEMLLTILAQSGFPLDWWYAICLHVIMTLSASPRSKSINTERGFVGDRLRFSPLECWSNAHLPHQMQHIFPFGCQMFYVNPLATKLDFKAEEAIYVGVGQATGTAKAISLALTGRDILTADYTVIENNFPHANPASGISPSVQEGLSTRFPKIIHDDPSLPWVITNKAVRDLGLKLQDAATVDALQSQLALGRPRDRMPSQAALMNIPDKDEPPSQQPQPVMLRERALHVIEDDFSVQDYKQESIGYALLARDTDIARSANDLALVMDEAEVEVSAHEWSKKTPKTIEQALSGPLKHAWLRSINKERSALIKNKVFGPPHDAPPPGVKPLAMEVRLKIKYRGKNKIKISTLTVEQLAEWLKTRAIVRGDRAVEGVHFNKTNAPTPAPDSVRAFLSLAVRSGMDLAAGDITTAFLNTPMDPPGVWIKAHSHMCSEEEITPETPPGKVTYHEMLKAIPGTPQASLLFYEDFASFLKAQGFVPSQADKCIFVRPGPRAAMLVLWVDDYIIGFQTQAIYDEFIAELKKKFDFTEKRELTDFLGIKIKFERGKSLFFSQEDILHSLLLKLGVPPTATSRTPGTPGFVHTKADCPTDEERAYLLSIGKTPEFFKKAAATVNYAACWGRGDLTPKVNKLAKFMRDPGIKHWQEMDKMLAYINRTKSWGILFGPREQEFNMGLHGYTDSSHNDCPDTSRATVGYLHRFFSDPISWSSKIHTYVTTCVNHSEYGALARGTQRMTWLAALFTDLYKVLPEGHVFPQIKPVVVFTDNAGAISLAYGNVFHGSNQYVRNSYHYAKEAQAEGLVSFQWISTNEQRANYLTKGLTPQMHDIEVVSYVSPPPIPGQPLRSKALGAQV